MNFFIYANSSVKIGLGHVVRQNVLAIELIKTGHTVTFVYSVKIDEHNNALLIPEANYKPIGDILSLECLPTNSLLIVDDYELSQVQWQHLFKIAPSLVFFDDGIGRPSKQVDLAINMSEQKSEHQIGKINLNGAKFRLIRNQIAQYRDLPYQHGLNSKELTVTVMLGATDAKGIMSSVCVNIIEFEEIKHVKILTTLPKSVVLAGLLKAKIAIDKIEVISNADNLGLEMKSSHFAISAAGGALYEYLCLGVPLITLVVADNQASALHCQDINNSCITLDVREKLNKHDFRYAIKRLVSGPQERINFSRSAAQLFDNLGAQRIVNHFEANFSK